MIIKVESARHKGVLEREYGWYDNNNIPFLDYSDLFFRVENKKIVSWGSSKSFGINNN